MDIKNHMLTGAILGLIAPALTFLIIHQIGFSNAMDLNKFINVSYNNNFLENLVSLSGIPNLAIFFLFLNFQFYKSARGIILSTFILVIIVVILKFFV